MKILDGKAAAAEWRRDTARRVAEIASRRSRSPQLAALLVGDDPASVTYVTNKARACEECGIRSRIVRLPATATQSEVQAEVRLLNQDRDIDGFIVQLPLPGHLDYKKLIFSISVHKDVDGFTPSNIGRMALGQPCLPPATPAGIIELLRRNDITTAGRNVAIIGRSNIVGRPMASLLLQRGMFGNATVTVCHSHTRNLGDVLHASDIIISAVGHPGLVTADMVTEGAVVIDVGITRVEDASRPRGYRLAGDVDFENVAPKCSYITPVPGGVGPMTIASLLHNTVTAYSRNKR